MRTEKEMWAQEEVLQLLREEAAAGDPFHAQAYGMLPWQAVPGQSGVLSSDDRSLFYEPQLLLDAFLHDTAALLQRYQSLCLHAFAARDPGCRSRHIFSSGGGKQGVDGSFDGAEAALLRRDTIDYRTFLQRFCIPREEAVPDLASFDYIPYLYGLQHYKNMPFLEPLEYSEVNRLDELAIAIDTSASCQDAVVLRFLEETWSILRQRENFFSRMRLHLIQCDSAVLEHRIFTGADQWEEELPGFKILGRGNTDFRPVFELLTHQLQTGEIRSLRALLYFTDGDGIYPRSAPPFDAAFVFLNRATEKGQLPDWAIRLNLDLPL